MLSGGITPSAGRLRTAGGSGRIPGHIVIQLHTVSAGQTAADPTIYGSHHRPRRVRSACVNGSGAASAGNQEPALQAGVRPHICSASTVTFHMVYIMIHPVRRSDTTAVTHVHIQGRPGIQIHRPGCVAALSAMRLIVRSNGLGILTASAPALNLVPPVPRRPEGL